MAKEDNSPIVTTPGGMNLLTKINISTKKTPQGRNLAGIMALFVIRNGRFVEKLTYYSTSIPLSYHLIFMLSMMMCSTTLMSQILALR
jgi:hypothetical protein